MQKLSERKFAFVQDPDYLAGYAGRLQANPMIELRLRELIRVHEMIDPDNWSFPGKNWDEYKPALNLGRDIWGQLGELDETDFTARYETQLKDFGFESWVFTYAAKAFDPDSPDLTSDVEAQRKANLDDLAANLATGTAEDFVYMIQSWLGMVFVRDPQSEAYAAIERVRNGMQPW
jgi:hypothetical protein